VATARLRSRLGRQLDPRLFVAVAWHGVGAERIIVAVNYAPNQSQCHLCLPFDDLGGNKWKLHDQLSDSSLEWQGDDLVGRGL